MRNTQWWTTYIDIDLRVDYIELLDYTRSVVLAGFVPDALVVSYPYSLLCTFLVVSS